MTVASRIRARAPGPGPLVALALSLCRCADGGPAPREQEGAADVRYTESRAPCGNRNPLRNVYFGDLHSHTSASMDAFAFGVRNGPDDAFRFARGEAVAIPGSDPGGGGARTARLDRPLDFAAVTDHGEYLGETRLCTTPGSEAYDTPACLRFRENGPDMVPALIAAFGRPLPQRNAAVCGAGGERCLAASGVVLREIADAARRASDLSARCTFSAFAGYEYTGSPAQSNMHRQVIFRNAALPERPTSYFEETNPFRLGDALERSCLDGRAGCDFIAVPHSTNRSNGRAFGGEGSAPGADARRARAEPVFEIYQHKGAAECLGLFSADPECAFESIPYPDCAAQPTGPEFNFKCAHRLNYYRGILAEGLRAQMRTGRNPPAIGVVGGTDTHNGTPGNTGEAAFPGHGGTGDADPLRRLEARRYSPGGLTGIWSVENSRDALFEAIRRRETFATSGTRISVRFFGGWSYPPEACAGADRDRIGYGKGVPMGGELPPPGPAPGSPSFLVAASQDATPLERIQIVKVWIAADGAEREAVFDVAGEAGAADAGEAGCAPAGIGHRSLCAVWSDPGFDPGLPAAYYARVLEVATCRWTKNVCDAVPAGARPPSCGQPERIRERAWTSPIRFSPRPE